MDYDRSEGLARALFEASGVAQFLCSPDGSEIYDANAAAQRLSGLSVRELLDAPVDRLFRTPDGPWSPPTNGNGATEYSCLLRNARPEVWTPVTLSVTRLSVRPRPIILLTARRDTAGLSGHLLDAFPDCLWSAELSGRGEGRFVYLSPAVEQVAGRPANFFAPGLRCWREIILPADWPIWDRANRWRLSGGTTRNDYRVVWPDGSIHWVRDGAGASRPAPGQPTCLSGVFSDITQDKLSEQKLRRRAVLADAAGEGILILSAEGEVLDWNRACERLYGYTRDEVRTMPFRRLFSPGHHRRHADAVRRIQRGERVGPYRAAQINAGGERVEVLIRASAIRKEDGNVDSLVVVVRPIRGGEPGGLPGNAE